MILTSWGIALLDYCLAVPANRIGHRVWSAAEPETIQEVVTLLVFSGFAVTWLGERLNWNHTLGFCLIALGAAVIFPKAL